MSHAWALWLLYFIGQAISILGRASASASSQFTPWNSVREYVKWHWPALVFRVFACTMGFLLWWNNTAFFEALVSNQLGVDRGHPEVDSPHAGDGRNLWPAFGRAARLGVRQDSLPEKGNPERG